MADPIRVLHIDDELDFAEVVGTFLEREHDRFDVETAANAAEAMDNLACSGFDCVLSDFDTAV